MYFISFYSPLFLSKASTCWELNTNRLLVHWGTPMFYCHCVMCSCVWRTTLLKKNKTCGEKKKQQKKKPPHTVYTQMFNVHHFRWTGHLLLAILYAPSASIWLLEISLNTLLVQQPWRKLPHKKWLVLFLGASADTERVISCIVMPCLHNVCHVSC